MFPAGGRNRAAGRPPPTHLVSRTARAPHSPSRTGSEAVQDVRGDLAAGRRCQPRVAGGLNRGDRVGSSARLPPPIDGALSHFSGGGPDHVRHTSGTLLACDLTHSALRYQRDCVRRLPARVSASSADAVWTAKVFPTMAVSTQPARKSLSLHQDRAGTVPDTAAGRASGRRPGGLPCRFCSRYCTAGLIRRVRCLLQSP